MKAIHVVVVIFGLSVSSLRAQTMGLPTYDGALEYSMPTLTAVPPIYPGQPSAVVSAYLWFDLAMRTYSFASIDQFFSQMSYSDTSKYIADALYRVIDDNPLSFTQWTGSCPKTYLATPGHEQYELIHRFKGGGMIDARPPLIPDTGRTAALLNADIIADIQVSDTVGKLTSASRAKYMILVNSEILDEIKGKRIPSCVDIYSAKRKGSMRPLATTVAWATVADTAASGACLQFEYSTDWTIQSKNNSDQFTGTPLRDSTGTWIKPGGEYIVFLKFIGLGADGAKVFFTVYPQLMYPVHSGVVSDPNDDFGMGAASGLSVAIWKSKLRSRINALINP